MVASPLMSIYIVAVTLSAAWAFLVSHPSEFGLAALVFAALAVAVSPSRGPWKSALRRVVEKVQAEMRGRGPVTWSKIATAVIQAAMQRPSRRKGTRGGSSGDATRGSDRDSGQGGEGPV